MCTLRHSRTCQVLSHEAPPPSPSPSCSSNLLTKLDNPRATDKRLETPRPPLTECSRRCTQSSLVALLYTVLYHSAVRVAVRHHDPPCTQPGLTSTETPRQPGPLNVSHTREPKCARGHQQPHTTEHNKACVCVCSCT